MISIVLPSWNRQQDLLRSIENIRATTQGFDVEIVVVLNHDDQASYKIIDHLQDQTGILVVTMPPDHLLGRPHRCWQTGYIASYGDWVVQTSDDTLFNPNWLAAALNYPNRGFIALYEPFRGRQLVTLFMATREYIDTVMGGYFGLTYYYSQWSDNEVQCRSRNSGRYACCIEASFVHLNRGLTPQPRDEYARMAEGRYKVDGETFQARLKAGFPVEWPEV